MALERSYYDGLEVVPSGLEVSTVSYPEVYHQAPEVRPHRDEKQLWTASIISNKPFKSLLSESQSTPQPRRRKRLYLWSGIAVAVILVLVISIAVSVSLKNASSSDRSRESPTSTPTIASTATSSATISTTSTTPTATVDPHKSTTGAYNGTGLSLIGTLNESLKYRLIYQHASGQIRQATLGDTWQEAGSGGIVVTTNGQNAARNGTPIAADSYPAADSIYHIFYANVNGVLCDRILFGSNGSWQDGNLSRSSFKMLDSPGAQLSFIWADDWAKGDSDGAIGSNGGLRIYWSGDDNRIHEASQPSGAANWTETYTFDADLIADSGFDAFVMNSVDYLWATASSTKTLTYYWRDNNVDGANSTSYPRGTWVSGVASTNVVRDLSALSYGGSSFLYYQNTQNNIIGINTSAPAPGGNLWGTQFQVGDQAAVPGTHIRSHSFYSTDTDGPQIRIYYQQNGSTITEWIRGVAGGSWSKNDIPVAA